MTRSDARILVALENPSREDALVHLAATLASSPNAELHLAHALTPDESNRNGGAARKGLDHAVEVAAEVGVVASPHLVEGETVTAAILDSAGEWGCNMMAMGWYADVDRRTILASTNRALAKSLDIDTLIFKEKSFHPAQKILVPTGGGGHSLMGLQIADDLAGEWGAELAVTRVARDAQCRPRDPILQRYRQQVREDTELRLRLLNIDAHIEVVLSPDVVSPIVDRASGSDLLVLGASNDWRQEEHLAGSIPDEIAYRAPCSVLMVRSRGPTSSQLSNIFWEQTIRLDLRPKDKWEAIDEMVNILVEEKQVPLSERDRVLAAARARELVSSTSIGRQTAIPHAPVEGLPGIIGALGICPHGVDFNGLDDQPVHFIFLLLTPQQNYRSYVPVLAQIATLMHSDESRSAFSRCQTPSELTAVIKRQEQR
jgi:mannitol/fructose-specific phosphotransferase system IIA component (Ntr-type)/nucleotide-binding universal stress UspA family protein